MLKSFSVIDNQFTGLEVLETDFLNQIIAIQKDILDDSEKDERTFMKDFWLKKFMRYMEVFRINIYD